MPKLVQVDDGKEFKGAVMKYFQANKVMMRQGKPNRHRQQSVVERFNATIARAIFTILHAKEIETKETQTAWVDNLPNIIINDNASLRRERTKETGRKLPPMQKDQQ